MELEEMPGFMGCQPGYHCGGPWLSQTAPAWAAQRLPWLEGSGVHHAAVPRGPKGLFLPALGGIHTCVESLWSQGRCSQNAGWVRVVPRWAEFPEALRLPGIPSPRGWSDPRPACGGTDDQ